MKPPTQPEKNAQRTDKPDLVWWVIKSPTSGLSHSWQQFSLAVTPLQGHASHNAR
jgi:hypothetical protein